MNKRNVSRAWAITLMGLGGLLTVGGSGEIANALVPGLLPDTPEIPFMAKHHSEPILRGWVLIANLLHLGCAWIFARAGLGLWRDEVQGWRRVPAAALIMAASALLGTAVCACYLLPLPSDPKAFAASGALGIMMLTSTVILVALMSLLRFAALRRLRREQY